jgi:hypothetical protein
MTQTKASWTALPGEPGPPSDVPSSLPTEASMSPGKRTANPPATQDLGLVHGKPNQTFRIRESVFLIESQDVPAFAIWPWSEMRLTIDATSVVSAQYRRI